MACPLNNCHNFNASHAGPKPAKKLRFRGNQTAKLGPPVVCFKYFIILNLFFVFFFFFCCNLSLLQEDNPWACMLAVAGAADVIDNNSHHVCLYVWNIISLYASASYYCFQKKKKKEEKFWNWVELSCAEPSCIALQHFGDPFFFFVFFHFSLTRSQLIYADKSWSANYMTTTK